MHRRGYGGDEQRELLGYGEAGPGGKKGDLLLTMDLSKIAETGRSATVIMAVTNTN